MKIAYFLESTALCGGVKVVMNQAVALSKRGHDVVLFSREAYPSWFGGNVPFVHVDGADPFLYAAESRNFDFLIATTLAHIPELSRFADRLVHLVQGYEGDYSETKGMEDIITRCYSMEIPKITVSRELASRLSALYPKGRFLSCGQGLEHHLFYPRGGHWTGTDPAFNGNSPARTLDTVFLVGVFTISIKNIGDGLRAFQGASRKLPNLKLVRISTVDTRLEEECLTGVRAHEYHVHLNPDRVGDIFRASNGIFLSPSSSGEGFGLPALEAMACGIPAVLTDIPSYRDFGYPRDYALFVPPGDVDAMAHAVAGLSRDRDLGSRLIKRGLDVAGRYSYEKVAEKLEELLLNVR
ncbi:MAG: glycosyltransferase family 4 protein [Desulfamplus sp.]|nr:glycosyltransferase family 4 protein [Desulfamplus sp.]